MFFPLLGYAPDADPTTPGVLVDCDLLIPTLKGFKALPGDSNAGITAGPSAVASVFTMRNLDGTNRIVAGTEGSASAKTASLYDVNASGWTNRDGAGGPYTATGSSRYWRRRKAPDCSNQLPPAPTSPLWRGRRKPASSYLCWIF